MRKIAKGHDGWYYQSEKIEPTPEEIQAWEDQYCDYCSMGSLMPRKGNLAEQCERQVPCPVCFGTGIKDHGKYFQKASHGKVISVGDLVFDPESFCMKRYVTAEFAVNYPGQQDGRPLPKMYEMYLKMLHIGRAVLLAMNEKGVSI
jgi:hypothetical protein